MKKLSSLVVWALLGGCASAAPYVVYSGSITGDNLSASGATSGTTLIFLATDLADTSNFAVLLVDPASKDYSVVARPSDSPTTDEASNNFLGSVGTGASADAVLTYSIETTDSSSNSTIARAYATGPLSTRNTVLVAARKSYVVKLKTNRVAQGTYTFSTPTAAISTGGTPYPLWLSGTSHGYVIDSGGALTHATTPGGLTLRENPLLTTDANIGGGFPVSESTEIALLPVSIANGQSESDALAAWLSAFARANGFVPPASAGVEADAASITLYGGGTAIGSDPLALSGSFSGASLVTVGAGTLVLTGANVYAAGNAGTLVANSSDLVGSVLTVGGLGTLGSNSSGLLTSSLGATGTLTINPGTLTLSSGPGIGGGSGPGPGTITSFSIATGTITISAINGNLVDGTVATTGLTITFTGAAFTLNGSGDLSSVTANEVFTGAAQLSGGSVTSGNTLPPSGPISYSSGTLSVTTP